MKKTFESYLEEKLQERSIKLQKTTGTSNLPSRLLVVGSDISSAVTAAYVYHMLPYRPAIDLIGSFQYGNVSKIINGLHNGKVLTDAEMQKYALMRLGVGREDIKIIINDRDNLDKYDTSYFKSTKSPNAYLEAEMAKYAAVLRTKRAENQRIWFCASNPLNAALCMRFWDMSPTLDISLCMNSLSENLKMRDFNGMSFQSNLLYRAEHKRIFEIYRTRLMTDTFKADMPSSCYKEMNSEKAKITLDKSTLFGKWQMFKLKNETKKNLRSIYEDREDLIKFMQIHFAQTFHFLTFERLPDYLDNVFGNETQDNGTKPYLVKK